MGFSQFLPAFPCQHFLHVLEGSHLWGPLFGTHLVLLPSPSGALRTGHPALFTPAYLPEAPGGLGQ